MVRGGVGRSKTRPESRSRSHHQPLDELLGTTTKSKTTPYPSAAIQIVTWYMADSLSFRALVNLLTTQPQYKRLVVLEFVAPSGDDVSQTDVDTLCDWFGSNRHLRRVTIYTVKHVAGRRKGSLTNPRERRYLKQIEEACTYGASRELECSIKFVPTGDPSALCDSLTNTSDTAGYYRHLAIDGHLLEGITQPDLQQLAFDLKHDRTIHVLIFKDMPPPLLSNLLPPLVNAPILQTLKLINDPSNPNTRTLPNAPPIQLPVMGTLTKELIANKKGKLKTLQRLYLGYWRFSATTTKLFVEGLRKSKSIRHLELGLCQFDHQDHQGGGCGKYFQQLIEDAKHRSRGITLKHIDFYFPIIGTTTTTANHKATPPEYDANSSDYITFWKSNSESSSSISSYQSPQFNHNKPTPLRRNIKK